MPGWSCAISSRELHQLPSRPMPTGPMWVFYIEMSRHRCISCSNLINTCAMWKNSVGSNQWPRWKCRQISLCDDKKGVETPAWMHFFICVHLVYKYRYIYIYSDVTMLLSQRLRGSSLAAVFLILVISLVSWTPGEGDGERDMFFPLCCRLSPSCTAL